MIRRFGGCGSLRPDVDHVPALGFYARAAKRTYTAIGLGGEDHAAANTASTLLLFPGDCLKPGAPALRRGR
jgi:hypothetical protein